MRNNKSKSLSMSSTVDNKSSVTQFRQAARLSSAVAMVTLSGFTGQAIAQDQVAEEIVVTGSFIRRTEGFGLASPVTTITADDIADQGVASFGDVIKNDIFNFGAATSTTDSIQSGADGGTSSVVSRFDLKGLGPSATLVLIDGKRVATNVATWLIPTIGIQRMDVLRDGAAQLYGADAVAGVVNFIPYESFDGIRVQYHGEQDSRGDYDDNTLSVLAGTDLAPNVNLVVAGEFRTTGTLKWSERPDLLRAGHTSSSNGNPGNFLVPQRDVNGVLTGSTVRMPDPNCGTTREDPVEWQNNTNGFLDAGRCKYDYGANQTFKDPIQQTKWNTSLNWDVNQDLSVKASFAYSRNLSRDNGSTSGSTINTSKIPTFRGELPFNPFPAVDANGNPVLALDANADGVPDRDANDVVILDPVSGIPFNEDVRPTNYRTFGRSNPNLIHSGIHNSDLSMSHLLDRRAWRAALDAEFVIPFVEGWTGTASYVTSRFEDLDHQRRLFSASAFQQGVACDVVNDRDSCYNPFAPIPGQPETFNDGKFYSAIATDFAERNIVDLETIDIVATGNISPGGFELPGGQIGAAFGYQRRDDFLSNTPAAPLLQDDAFTARAVDPLQAGRYVDAYFVELSLPVLSNLELSYSYRLEEYNTGQEPDVDKFGIVYRPLDWLTLRGTYGEAFIAPSLTQLFANESCGSRDFSDPFTVHDGFTFGCLTGNINLNPESSETTSFGIDLTPIDNLSISFNWSETDFSERIVRTTLQQIGDQDFLNFQAATGFVPSDAMPFPSEAAVDSWAVDPRSDKRIQREPGNPSQINRINISDSNAASVTVTSYDLTVDYDLPILRSLGDFNVNMQANYIDNYDFQQFAGDPIVSAEGKQNDRTGSAPALPQLRAILGLSWRNGPHRALVTTRYTDDVIFDAAQRRTTLPFHTWRHTDVIKEWTQMDLQYTYSGVSMPGVGGNLSFSVGSRNLFDREAQKTGMIAGPVAELQEVLGRVVYARFNYEF